MLISDICGSSMNLGRGNEQSNPRIRIIRESSLKRMNWLYKHKESVHEGTKKQSVQMKVILSCLFFLGSNL